MHENTEIHDQICKIYNDGENSIVRTIFLNLLKIFLIVILYFYLSERYMAVSAVSNPGIGYSPFIPALLVLGFLSVLAGSIPGFLSGFLGELLFQVSFYMELKPHWFFIIGIFGGICGIYKYRPQKYQILKPILYTISIISIASLISLFLLTIFENFEVGLRFFLQIILSVIIILPPSLYTYDRFLARKERHIYHEFLTHHPPASCDHTFYLQFGRTYFYFCTRCSGFVIGALFSTFSTYIITLIFNITISPEIALLFCIILPIPGLIDWGTQRLLLRKSTTESRLLTGFLIGIALHYISFTEQYAGFLLLIIIIDFTVFFIIMQLGYRKELRIWNEEMEKLNSDLDDDEVQLSSKDS